MAIDIDTLATKVRKLRDHFHTRDARWADLLAIRQGDIQQVFPGMFPDEFPKPMVSNFIDVAARDVAEVIAPLPAFNCDTTDTISDRARKRADKLTMIAAGYRDTCKLQTLMYRGADVYVTYGMLAFVVEADFENKRPMIRIDNAIGTYPEYDRFGKLLSYSKRYQKTVRELCNEFPEFESQLRGKYEGRNSERMLELYRYQDKNEIILFVPERMNLVLERTKNPLDEIPIVIATRPGLDSDENPRGQFDDIMWVQVARSRMMALQLEAAQKSVQAPFALPADVNVLEIGPDATIRSANPEKIRRVGLDIPNGIFQETAQLDQELRLGARYPEGRLGQQSGSIVTGRGVQALMGGFDTQVKTAQAVLAETFRHVMRLCFKMDETYFGDIEKEVRGVNAGAPYELTYKPKDAIRGDYWVDVTYGLMAGLDPKQIDALVLSTTTPDRQVPATSARVQHELGLSCGAFDINAACSGFVYGLVVAHGLIAMGSKKVLLIGTDTLSRITDWSDRNTAILFADGSGAAVIEATTGPSQLLGWDLDADGSAEELLYAEIGGNIHMDGKEVFRRAVRIMVDSAQKSMAAAGVTADQLALVVPHQANARIIQAACERLGVPMEKTSPMNGLMPLTNM